MTPEVDGPDQHPEGEVIAAFDNDRAGDELCESLEKLVQSTGAKVTFRVDRPHERGRDWNDNLREQAALRGQAHLGMSL